MDRVNRFARSAMFRNVPVLGFLGGHGVRGAMEADALLALLADDGGKAGGAAPGDGKGAGKAAEKPSGEVKKK